MKGDKSSQSLKLLIPIITFALTHCIAANAEEQQQQQQIPYDAKKFRIDTWKYQESFDFPDVENEGPWKQGFDLKLTKETINHKKIYVHVVPWSHIDPGSKSSYTNAFNTHISKIITSVVSALEAKPSRRFIWPEVCVLQRWYVAANEEQKASFRRVVSNGQFEIVTGGWVMADEALTYYETLLDELSEGHDWLQRAIGAKPKVAFSIDVAGHSPVMNYMLKKSGLKGSVINKIHYAYKKELAENRALDFFWEPSWSTADNDRMLTHVLPFYSYNAPYTCGPDPSVCSKYDFTKIGKQTMWGDTVKAVNTENIGEFAENLVDQYKKQALLSRNNHILVLLGGNSYYESLSSIDAQLTSYQSIFDYINADSSFNVRIAFSNLSNWFNSFDRPKKTQPEKDMPVIRGDFFPYADKNDDYWSGYYSLRGFYKRQSREFGSLIKSTQSLFTLLVAFSREPDDKADITAVLQRGRRSLDLYQTHNGITGVSSKPAQREFAKTIHDSRWAIKNSMLLLLQHALSREGFPDTPVMDDFDHNELKRRYNELPAQSLIRVPSVPEEVRPIVFANSLPHTRTEYASLIVDSQNVHIMDGDGHIIQSQIMPVIEPDFTQKMYVIDTDRYIVTFPVTLAPMGITTVFITIGDGIGEEPSSSANLCKIYLSSATKPHDNAEPMPSGKGKICLKNDKVTACFDRKTGDMTTLGKTTPVQTTPGDTTASEVRFEESYPEYSVKKSGQNVLKMDTFKSTKTSSPADDLCFVSGIYTEELMTLSGSRSKRARVYKKGESGAPTKNIIDEDDDSIVATSFVELNVITNTGFDGANTLRFRTGIRSGDKFVTDINGFAYTERKYRKDKSIPASMFPVTTTLYTEDSTHRVSFHFSQALGAVCHSEGENDDINDDFTSCEFMVDRHSKGDDGKGVPDKVDDGVQAIVDVRITIEDPDPTLVEGSRTVTELSHILGMRMNNPLQYAVGRVMPLGSWTNRFGVEVAPLSVDLPSDVEVAAFRPLGSALNGGEVAITLARHLVGRPINSHNTNDDITEDEEGVCVSIIDMFKCAQAIELTEHTLTFINELGDTGEGDISDGVVCLKKGSMHSYSFNVRADGECRMPGVGYPRKSRWNANGIDEDADYDDDQHQQTQQQYDGEDEDFATPFTGYNENNNIEDDDNYDTEIANAILAYRKRMGTGKKPSKHDIIEEANKDIQTTTKKTKTKTKEKDNAKKTDTITTATPTTTTPDTKQTKTVNTKTPMETTVTETETPAQPTDEDLDNQLTPPGIPIDQAVEQQEQKEAAEAEEANKLTEELKQIQIDDVEKEEENEKGKEGNTEKEKKKKKKKYEEIITIKEVDNTEEEKFVEELALPKQNTDKKNIQKDTRIYTKTDHNLDGVFTQESTSKKFYGLLLTISVLVFALFLYIKRVLSPRQFGMILIFTCLTNIIILL